MFDWLIGGEKLYNILQLTVPYSSNSLLGIPLALPVLVLEGFYRQGY